MRKIYGIFGAMALFSLASCSTNEDLSNQNQQEGEKGTSYIAVNVIAANGGATRAEEEYEDGTATENKVSKIRFYFFKGEEAAKVVGSEDDAKSYYEISNYNDGQDTGKDPENVEKILGAMLVINTSPTNKGEANTTDASLSMIAILNYPADFGTDSPSLSDLYKKVDAYSSTESFMMSNAIHLDGTNKLIRDIPIDGHLRNDQTEALSYPVTIYVERVLAKAAMNTSEDLKSKLKAGASDIYSIGGEGDATFAETKVYAKLLGWEVTADANKSYALKHINDQWNADMWSSSNPWNISDYHRSFWALNPTTADAEDWKLLYHPFNTATTGQLVFDKPSGEVTTTDKNYTYLQENAGDPNATTTGNPNTKPSQIIIYAQLVNEEGNALNLAEWGFKEYACDANLSQIKAAMLSSLAEKGTVYKQVDQTVKSIEASDIEFKTISAVTNSDGTLVDEGRYYVYAQLASEAATEWYTKENMSEGSKIDKDAVNQKLKDLGRAKIWKTGYCYYYVDIKHLNQKPLSEGETGLETSGYFGVVRNHIYNFTLNTLKGLGTPVYEPTETIIPEKPGDDDTYCGADIRILSWRLVNQQIDLDW